MINQACTKMLNHDEGFSAVPYYDTLGFPTIGIGRKIGNKGDPLPNITTDRETENNFLEGRIKTLIDSFSTHINTRDIFPKLSEIRQAVLVCMAYQMGFAGVLQFRQMLAALARNDFDGAANEIINSQLHAQTTKRCEREANMLKTGMMDAYYGQ